jgi:hypothetical protein
VARDPSGRTCAILPYDNPDGLGGRTLAFNWAHTTDGGKTFQQVPIYSTFSTTDQRPVNVSRQSYPSFLYFSSQSGRPIALKPVSGGIGVSYVGALKATGSGENLADWGKLQYPATTFLGAEAVWDVFCVPPDEPGTVTVLGGAGFRGWHSYDNAATFYVEFTHLQSQCLAAPSALPFLKYPLQGFGPVAACYGDTNDTIYAGGFYTVLQSISTFPYLRYVQIPAVCVSPDSGRTLLSVGGFAVRPLTDGAGVPLSMFWASTPSDQATQVTMLFSQGTLYMAWNSTVSGKAAPYLDSAGAVHTDADPHRWQMAKSADMGLTWAALPDPPPGPYGALSLAAGGHRLLWRIDSYSDDDGQTWKPNGS